jgi:hypothetical protein
MTPVVFGSQEALRARRAEATVTKYEDTRQDIAIVLCGGGAPLEELARAIELCGDKPYTILAGNDQIAEYAGHIDHAVTLHPDKLAMWIIQRKNKGYEAPGIIWAHRPHTGVERWSRDWAGSTGLLAIKIARELGFTHVILCGVHMTVEGNHFLRQAPWKAAYGFRRGWTAHMRELRDYVRSFGGWTKELFGEPTAEWCASEIVDKHRYQIPGTGQHA